MDGGTDNRRACMRRHVHPCIAMLPKYPIAEVIATMKEKGVIGMFGKFPDQRNRYWGSHFWSRGYYVNTVRRDGERIRKCIKD